MQHGTGWWFRSFCIIIYNITKGTSGKQTLTPARPSPEGICWSEMKKKCRVAQKSTVLFRLGNCYYLRKKKEKKTMTVLCWAAHSLERFSPRHSRWHRGRHRNLHHLPHGVRENPAAAGREGEPSEVQRHRWVHALTVRFYSQPVVLCCEQSGNEPNVVYAKWRFKPVSHTGGQCCVLRLTVAFSLVWQFKLSCSQFKQKAKKKKKCSATCCLITSTLCSVWLWSQPEQTCLFAQSVGFW